MAAPAMNRLVDHLKRTLATEQLTDLPDAELLERVVQLRDQQAFEAIVRRHGPLVLKAANAVLRDPADVEDAFQAAFVALWRSGKNIRRRTSLGAWLYGVSRRAALKAVARAQRRRMIEASANSPIAESPDLSWRDASGSVA